MEWTEERLARLYELYQRHIESLRRDVTQVNLSLGSPPEKAEPRLQPLTLQEFGALIRTPRDREVADLWIRRIIRGNEHEFRELQAAS